MSSVSPLDAQTSIQEEKVNPYPRAKPVDPVRKELISIARRAFSAHLYTDHADKNFPNMHERFIAILQDNMDLAKELKDVNAIALLMFGKYLDVEIETILPIIHQEIPALNRLEKIDDTLRDEFRFRAHSLHSMNIRKPIVQSIRDLFSDRNFGEIKIDLS